MRINGKIVGALTGLILFPPFGVFIGLFIGHLYDIGRFDHFLSKLGFTRPQHTHAQELFFDATFSIMGYIAKSDGRITQSEIDAAREVMNHLKLTGSARERAIKSFYRGKKPEFDLDATIARLKQYYGRHPTLLRTFLEYQLYIANADGKVSTQKQATLQIITQKLGLRGFNFHQHQRQSRAEYNYQRYQQGTQQQYTQRNQLDEAYDILGVSKSASTDEVRKAYRRQMSKNHPDKLVAKGLPPEMIQMANEKTARIKKAYETIKAAKGW